MRHLLRLVAIFGLVLAMTSCYSSYEEDIIPWAYRSVYGQKYDDAFCKSHTEIVDHGIDNNNIGSVYTGYYVVYEMTNPSSNSRKYALVSIIEYDDGSRYNYEMYAVENSLRDINAYLEPVY